MTLAELQAQRTRTLKEIKDRGGAAKAPNYSKRLSEIEAQIRAVRGTEAKPPAANPAAGTTNTFTAPPIPEDKGGLNSFDTPGEIINSQADINNKTAMSNSAINRPDEVKPTGSRTVTENPDGSVKIEEKLTDPQDKILKGDEAISIMGRNLANSNLAGSGLGSTYTPEVAQRTLNATSDDRDRVERDVFTRLTRDAEEKRAQDKRALEQQLYERGIPIGSDAYNRQVGELDKRYDNLASNARADAIALGGQEQSRQFGMQEQLIGNQYSQSAGVRNQQIGEASSLGGMGTGLLAPNFTPFAQVNVATQDVGGTVGGVRGSAQTDQQLKQQREQAAAQEAIERARIKASGRSSGGGGGKAQEPASPFVNRPYGA